MRLRQVALVARKLDPVVPDICAVLGIEVAFNDPGVGHYGLENAVMVIGDTFLEVVAPVTEGTTAGRFLDRRGGDGGYMAIFQCDDIAAERRHVESLGIRIVERIDLANAWGTHLHPRDVGAAILSIDAMAPREEWLWAGPRWRECVRTDVSTGVTGAEVQADDHLAVARRWAEVLRAPLDTSGGDAVLALEGGRIHFVPAADGRGDGVGGVEVAVRDLAAATRTARERGLPVEGNTVTMCGTRFRLLPT